jgi:membrane-bound ClpP family serine protease
MADTSIVFGILLVILGVYGFFTTHMEHPTALIPTGVGVILIILGALARKESLRKHAMHAAAVVGVLGFIAGAGRFFYELSKGMDVTGTAGMSTATMAVLCAVFVALCVKSFMEARRRRNTSTNTPMSNPRL